MRVEFSILSVHEPAARHSAPIAVLLIFRDKLLLRCRQPADLNGAADAEILAAIIEDIRENAWKMGANEFVSHLEDTLSHWLRISDRQEIETDNPTEEINRLYTLYIDP
jgi:hypothetical protein